MDALIIGPVALLAGCRQTVSVIPPLRRRFEPSQLVNLGDYEGVFVSAVRIGGEPQLATSFRLPLAVFEPGAAQQFVFSPCVAGCAIEIDIEPDQDRLLTIAIRGRYVDGRTAYARKKRTENPRRQTVV